VSALSATHWQPPGGTWPDDPSDPAWLAHAAARKAAWERCNAFTRLYTRAGKRAHLCPPWSGSPLRDVLCGLEPWEDDGWLGTGSQREYDLAAELETCSRCRRLFMDSQRCGNPECQCQTPGDR
jgi:hypothetical protein